MSSKAKVKISSGVRLDLINNPAYMRTELAPAEIRTVEQDRELVVASEQIYQAGVHDAILELGNIPEASECFSRFKQYKAVTGKRIFAGIDANPEDIKQIKAERQAFAKDLEEIMRKKFDPHNKGYVEVENLETAKKMLNPALTLVSMARATRNLTFSNKPLIDSLREQSDCFSTDRSSMAPDSGIDNTDDIESLEKFMQGIFQKFVDSNTDQWRPPRLRQKKTSCLESNVSAGGRNAFEVSVMESMLSVIVNSSNIDLLQRAFDTGALLGMKQVKLKKGERVRRNFIPDGPKRPYGKYHSFQDIKLVSMLVYGVQEQKISIFPYDIGEDLIVFDGAKDRYNGTRIIELAGKDRTVSIGSAVISVIGEFLASQCRGILLHIPEFTEGYLGGENMCELLSRMNASEGDRTSPFDESATFLLQHPELLVHKEPKPETAKRRRTESGEFIENVNDDGRDCPLRILITDFTAATENISHRFSRLIASQFRLATMPGEILAGARWATAHASYIEFISSSFAIDYAGGAGGEFSVESENGVGLLMGCAYTKEILHIASAWASSSEHDCLNRARLVLGDDLLLLLFSRFLKRAHMAGLQTNFSKTQITFMPTLTDRSIVIVKLVSGQDAKFEILGCDIAPPKLYSVSAKYTEGREFYCTVPRIGAIRRSLVSEDLEAIRFPGMHREIEDVINSISFLREAAEHDLGRGIPLAYGGSSWLGEKDERDWMLSNCATGIANLFGANDGRFRVHIFHADRSHDWSKVGFIRIDTITHYITDYCPSFIGLNDKLESDRKEVLKAKEFLAELYPEDISSREYPSSVFYISPEDILKIFSESYCSDNELFNYSTYKTVRLDNEDYGQDMSLLEYLDILASGVSTSAKVPRPPI
jgi:hypothetical protein